MRQGDHLSLILSSLAKDVLSRHIDNLLNIGRLIPMKVTIEVCFPAHILYTYDILILCKGKLSNIVDLKELFLVYSRASCQVISYSKSNIYLGFMSNTRANHLTHISSFTRGSLTF